MLVLSRRKKEELVFGDEIVVRILKITGQCVRIGIEAPSHIRIRRGELDADGTPESGTEKPPVNTEIEPSEYPRPAEIDKGLSNGRRFSGKRGKRKRRL